MCNSLERLSVPLFSVKGGRGRGNVTAQENRQRTMDLLVLLTHAVWPVTIKKTSQVLLTSSKNVLSPQGCIKPSKGSVAFFAPVYLQCLHLFSFS